MQHWQIGSKMCQTQSSFVLQKALILSCRDFPRMLCIQKMLAPSQKHWLSRQKALPLVFSSIVSLNNICSRLVLSNQLITANAHWRARAAKASEKPFPGEKWRSHGQVFTELWTWELEGAHGWGWTVSLLVFKDDCKGVCHLFSHFNWSPKGRGCRVGHLICMHCLSGHCPLVLQWFLLYQSLKQEMFKEIMSSFSSL